MPLSWRLALKQQAIDYLETVKKSHPAAYASQATIFFYKNNPEDVAERRELLLERGLDPKSVYVMG